MEKEKSKKEKKEKMINRKFESLRNNLVSIIIAAGVIAGILNYIMSPHPLLSMFIISVVFFGIIIYFINKNFLRIFMFLILIGGICYLLFWPIDEKAECRYDTWITSSSNIILQIEDISDDYSEECFWIRFTFERKNGQKNSDAFIEVFTHFYDPFPVPGTPVEKDIVKNTKIRYYYGPRSEHDYTLDKGEMEGEGTANVKKFNLNDLPDNTVTFYVEIETEEDFLLKRCEELHLERNFIFHQMKEDGNKKIEEPRFRDNAAMKVDFSYNLFLEECILPTRLPEITTDHTFLYIFKPESFIGYEVILTPNYSVINLLYTKIAFFVSLVIYVFSELFRRKG